jgi:hypothetical protein
MKDNKKEMFYWSDKYFLELYNTNKITGVSKI